VSCTADDRIVSVNNNDTLK